MPADPSTYCLVCGLAWQVRGCKPGKCLTWTLEAAAEQLGVQQPRDLSGQIGGPPGERFAEVVRGAAQDGRDG